ncbi:GNAT family N-acetyltransferase [Clostridiaceae bacterium M8S5]|nr:GNAT family N-acetyltransferase [Clostridiaceae bacterium M8S5]
MFDKKIEYIIGSKELLDEVQPLWEELNEVHIAKSIDFSDYFSSFNFSMRKNSILNSDRDVFIILAKDAENDKFIGYIIASIDNKLVGEIDSLYVKSDYRGKKIGKVLMEKALEWLSKKDSRRIKIGVAVGNESVIGMYKKYNFYPKVTILEKKN